MLNKKDILYKLDQLKYYGINTDKFIVLSGASLVLQGIIPKTKDIDLAVPKDFFDKHKGIVTKGAFGKEIKTFGVFEISYNLYDSDYIIVEGYKCATIESVLKTKKKLNRKKDMEIIKHLESLIEKKSS